jgi:hypothetical protein
MNQKKTTTTKEYVVYKISCKTKQSEYVYIGSSKEFKARKKSHMDNWNNKKSKEYNKILYKEIRACGGWENWNIEIIKQCCDEEHMMHSEEMLIKQSFISVNERHANNQ